MNALVEPGTIDIALLHGTWAKNAAWTQPDFALTTKLKDLPDRDVNVIGIPWPGRNSELARAKGASNVRDFVVNSDADVQVVVGHSHGGNVGATALHCTQSNSSHALVTLNTPFLNATRRSTQVREFHAILLVFGLCFFAANVLRSMFSQSFSLAAELLAPFAVIVGLVVAWLVVTNLTFVVLRIFKINPKLVEDYIDELGSVSVMPDTDDRTHVLCISTSDDEALGWLQVAESLLNLPFLILHRFALPIVLVVICIAHYKMQWNFSPAAIWTSIVLVKLADGQDVSIFEALNMPASVNEISAEGVTIWSDCIWGNLPDESFCQIFENTQVALTIVSIPGYFMMFWVLLAVAGLLGAYYLGAIFFGTGFGLKGVWFAFSMRWHVSPVPTTFKNVTLINVDANSGWLRHSSIYSDEAVQSIVSAWISALPRQP